MPLATRLSAPAVAAESEGLEWIAYRRDELGPGVSGPLFCLISKGKFGRPVSQAHPRQDDPRDPGRLPARAPASRRRGCAMYGCRSFRLHKIVNSKWLRQILANLAASRVPNAAKPRLAGRRAAALWLSSRELIDGGEPRFR